MTEPKSKPGEKNNTANKLGTFSGVFTPSILTILGIILFMRLGYVVGAAGLRQALLILLIANTISVLTSLSLSAIATNLTVRGGGDYYLISRTLGFEFGGALGLVLFLAQSVSVGFYCIGFGEVVAGLLGGSETIAQFIALFAIAALFSLAWKGADWATRFQYAVMGILCLAVLSFFIGGVLNWNADLLQTNWLPAADGPGFWVLFAVFFPAATGFTQGVSMSGDLQDPGKSLPLGTFLAVGVSILVYLVAAILFAGNLPQDVLSGDFQAMNRVAIVPFLIVAGVFAATLSSAMASFLGAPRILQSMAADKVFPVLNLFAKGVGPANNPQRATLFAAAIAVLTVGLGNLNLIARVVTMFFLISYGLLNYATYFEARAASPSFRPRFKWFHQRASFAGALICLFVMLAIDWKSGALAVAVLYSLYQYLKRTSSTSRWADSQRSYHLQQVREHLLQISRELEHPRDWRPQVLTFSEDRERRIRLLKFSSWMVGKSGLITAVQILEGKGAQQIRLKNEAENELYQDIADSGVQAFPLVVNAPSFEVGNQLLLQTFGIGPLRANTILLNHHGVYAQRFFSAHFKRFGQNLRTSLRLGYNLVVLDALEEEWQTLERQPANERCIDIWYQSGNTGSLMLLLGYLMTRSDFWSHARLRVLVAEQDDNAEATKENLRQELERVRITAEAVVVKDCSAATIIASSADASLVFLPLALKEGRIIDSTGEMVDNLLPNLPLVALIVAAQQIDLDAEPESGAAGLLADAEDAVAAAQKRQQLVDEEIAELNAGLEKTLTTLIAARKDGNEEEAKTLYADLAKIRQQLDKATRRSAKADSKLEQDKERLEKLREEYHLNESTEEDAEDKNLP
ncbi:transporter, cation-chloride cotransporter (CCC) family [Desulfuromusa kysingii]|uniref:Transporter, cation-chloride cotransporter (CCC) family n=1 Tax=Desulfuromusa kysingii TaxID=37625 RepID=A0A1H3W1G7_9BACT|nr:amino acid permease [Desulfuromusa kysingii]SDZ80741.1 transporter, cation-chloride cotransporter (CCC) family [Desulfuromusa kysingii]